MTVETSRAERALFIISVATGYGGAERNIEVLLPRIPVGRKVVLFACNHRHLEALRRTGRPNLEIHFVDAAQDGFVEKATRLLIGRYLAVRPSAILSNTLDSLRILSSVAKWLPGIDHRSFFYVHDFLWSNYAALLSSLPGATMLAPNRAIFERADYVGRFIQPEGGMRALVLPNPVEPPVQDPGPPAGGAGFLHLATVNGFKGHVYLADAAAILGKSRAGVRIESYGHRPIPELYREISRHIEEVGAEETLTLRDHVDDPSDLLKRSRAVVVTSVSDNGGPETFGRAIIEAWAYRRPVIAFAAGAPADLIRHEVDGLLVDEKDAAGLAEAIARMWRDDDLAERLGRAGRERVSREFSAEIIAAQLLAALDGGRRLRLPTQAATLKPPEAEGRIFLDVSLSLNIGWRTPVGMSRVETEVANELARLPDKDVQLARRNAANAGFRRLAPFELEALTNRSDGMAALAARELAASPPPSPPCPDRTLAAYWAAVAALRSIGAGPRLIPGAIRRWLFRRVTRKTKLSSGEGALSLKARSGDVLICAANPWDYIPAGAFQSLRAQGVRLLAVVHDLMVWETPHWTAGRNPREYSRNMLAAIAEAEHVVAVSSATAKAMKAAFASIGKVAPPVTIAPPSGLSNAAPFGGPPPGVAPGDAFVLYCSTIEVRKNHIMLLNLWDRLRQSLPWGRLPRLIIVGRWGWGVDAVRLMIERNWRLAPHVRVIEQVCDHSLSWLYRNARFTVFPSFTEGFGLPAVESLRAGTPVVVSNCAALVEATEGLMPAIDPYDLPAWRREIETLCLDDARLEALREKARRFAGAKPQELPRAILAAIAPRRE
jgi:glycosyltransferase involved in cell wall biosynthesis